MKRRESQDLPCRAIVRIQLLLVKSLEQCLVGSKCCVNYRFVNLDGLEQGSNRIDLTEFTFKVAKFVCLFLYGVVFVFCLRNLFLLWLS